MPLQNRVDPFGEIFRTPARGTMMGNRGGALHTSDRQIVRKYTSRRWITCVLQFKGRCRKVMSEGRYTELFFLDEATSFAAGHRPCAECRRERYNAFRQAWQSCSKQARPPVADEMDLELHAARIERGKKVAFEAALGSLPDGVFVRVEESAHLLWRGKLLLWTPEGYVKKQRAQDAVVAVLTPKPIVGCFREGYVPDIHASWQAL